MRTLFAFSFAFSLLLVTTWIATSPVATGKEPKVKHTAYGKQPFDKEPQPAKQPAKKQKNQASYDK